jgi:tRNA pseudouridine38-40 synthase
VKIKAVQLADPDFHARYSALWRGYRYRIASEPTAIGRAYAWIYPHPLSVPRMNAAAQLILGDRCFRSFAHDNEKESHYLSSMYRAEWREIDKAIEFEVEANRFLHGMVRLLVGTFVQIGRGKIEPDRITEILDAQDVQCAGPKAPPWGLTLECVGYRPWREL